MSIEEFLLERIANDEESAGCYVDFFPDRDMSPLFRRVLAECAAKRTIVAAHRSALDPYGDAAGATCTMCVDSGPDAQGFPCSTVRALAAVYSDHPDYQEEWKP